MIVDSDSDGEGGGEEEDAGMDIKNPPKYCSIGTYRKKFSH